MKIQNQNPGAGLTKIDTGHTERANADAAKMENEEVNRGTAESSVMTLSPKAQEMKRIKGLAMAAPDVDMEKVARFQKMIDEGKYQVDADKLADKMVDEHLAWGE